MQANFVKYIFGLLCVGIVLYLPALPNHFVWDDEEQVVANTAVHSMSHMREIFAGSTFNSGGSARLGGLYYKPLMSLSFAVVYSVFGQKPWAFHLLQISLHLACVLLLFIILQKLWKWDNLAFFVSLVFLVHPQNVETVVYISSLQDTLYMFFGMLGLCWVVMSEGVIRWYDMVFAASCVFLALLSKETGALFSIIIGSYLVLLRKPREVWWWVVASVSATAIYMYLRLQVGHVGLDKNVFTPMATLPLVTRLGNIPSIIGHYLSDFVWPSKLSISQHWVDRSPGILQYSQLAAITATWICGLWWGVYKMRSKGRILVFFWVWAGAAMAFHSQIFPLDMTVADRWFYLPVIGILGSVGSYIQYMRVKNNKLIWIVIMAGLVALFVRSSVRIANWRDGLTLYSHDARIMTSSFDLENNLGVELYRVGMTAEAKIHFTRSTQLSPSWWTNWNNLGAVVESEGALEQAKSYYKKAMDNGQYYLSYPNYAQVLIKQNKIDEAKSFVQKSLKLYPNNAALLDLYQRLSILKP